MGSAVNALSAAWQVAQALLGGFRDLRPNAYVESAQLKGFVALSLWRRALAAPASSEVSYGAAANVCAAGSRWQEVQEKIGSEGLSDYKL